MLKLKLETWLTLFVLGVGAVIVALAGLWIYVSATATPLHPSPQAVASVTHSATAAKWAPAVERARQVVRAGVAEQNLPGLSVAVGIGGAIVWAEGFGFADLEKKTAVEPGTTFRIGTATIPLTSAAVGLLIEQGRLNLDDVIQKHVPECPEKEWPVTLRQVMGHLAGIRSDGGDESPMYAEHCNRPIDALRMFADGSLRFEPGTQFQVSRFGFILVSAAVEAAADEPFMTFMRRQIFEPLGMDETRPDSITDSFADRATPYFPRFAADPRYGPDVMREIDLSCYAGGGALLSTPSDLVRFGMAIDGGTLLQPATVELLQASQRLPSGEETGYGLGWDLETVTLAGEQARVAGHDGDLLGGMVASLMTFRQQGIVVSVISNPSYADTFAIGSNVARAFAAR